MRSVQEKWDNIYQQKVGEPPVAEVLQHNHYLLPEKGVALDLACGLGGNAMMLAEKGLSVMAWDISPVAIAFLDQAANVRGFDVLLVSLFLERSLCPALLAALKPGGLLLYQTYCQEKVHQGGPNNPDYLLADNELLELFPGLKLRVYREESLLGRHDIGMRNQAWMMAEKPLL
jgi:SAM-dependent methyltransferase